MTAATRRSALSAVARAVGLAAASAVSAGLVVALTADGLHRLSGNRMAPWILGRAAGVCAYLLLVVLVISGQLLSHPARAQWRRPSTATRIRAHIVLAPPRPSSPAAQPGGWPRAGPWPRCRDAASWAAAWRPMVAR